MRTRKLVSFIYSYFLVCTVAALAVTVWHAAYSMRQFSKETRSNELLVRARIIARELGSMAGFDDRAKLDSFCKEMGRLSVTRITVVLPDGTVVGDSDDDPAKMHNHADRYEVAAALSGQTGKAVRFSETLHKKMIYIALPVEREGKTVAVIRTAMPLSVIEWSSHAALMHVIYAGLIVAIVFGFIAYAVSRRISRQLDQMRLVAERLSSGDLDARIMPFDIDELDSLGAALNRMASQLGDRLSAVTRHQNEQDTVLAGMSEGVLCVDRDENIVTINGSAARLLDVDPDKSRGRCIQEIVRNPELQKFISAALTAQGVMESEISFYGFEEKCLQLHGTVLKDHDGRVTGALVVFNDITRLKKLEQMRKDFVANASHELKTPITAMKGCVETLHGIIPAGDADSSRFLEMMGRHMERLQALVDDLLSLSTVDHSIEKGELALEKVNLRDLLTSVEEEFRAVAASRKTVVSLECSGDAEARVNAVLIEQAVGNLVDNAIKYSPDGAKIAVICKVTLAGVDISVVDNGPGMEKRHLPRIFERFYRVDLARSRAMGGTGLGLAIVKNIALAHQGSVSVSSIPGQGSTFSIHIPG